MSRVEVETVSLSEGNADRALWRAVITQALTDATMYCGDGDDRATVRAKLERDRALSFLTHPSAWFNVVCDMADLEPSQVRRLAFKAIADANERSAERKAERTRRAERSRESYARHPREPKRYEFNGHSLPLEDWAAKTGLNEATIRTRLQKGWSIERALTEPSVWSRKKKPGVVENFSEAPRDRPGSVAQESA